MLCIHKRKAFGEIIVFELTIQTQKAGYTG